METMTFYKLLNLLMTTFCLGGIGITMNLVLSVHAIESPQYTVVRSESEFEIRLYKESSWMSALVQGTSFQKSTKDGFHRLYQYMHGANLNSYHMAITAPVLTSIISSSSQGYNYSIKIYLSVKYRGNNTPQPNTELNLQLDKWRTHCIAVRKFTGFAKDDNVNEEIETLISSLNKHLPGKSVIIDDKSSSIAQYNASFRISGRLNEVWMNVSGFTAEGCPS
ncbi:heme-binding protein 2-like [Quillaja saponaria]|uniref:Heme-binding protein 2-like n=1 Tax=Quillaja saponaria TaxID=32244 RepID=A0AAD7P6E9_QUISA|nr:heme-binding protein 2-like [Quillaja saponaria]